MNANRPLDVYICVFAKRRIPIDKVPTNIPLGKLVAAWFASTEEIGVEYSFNPISLRGQPVPFEIEFGLTNASDCVDWLNDNKA